MVLDHGFQKRRGWHDKLVGVFRPDELARLIHQVRQSPSGDKNEEPKGEAKLEFGDDRFDMDLVLTPQGEGQIEVKKLPLAWLTDRPVFFPTRELLTLYPNFVSVYEGRYLQFEESWRDTCLLLGEPLKKGVQEARIKQLLEPLERAMEGALELDKNGRFYLKVNGEKIEIPLVAEGFRKLGMLARLIANGTLLERGYLFWDEPDANLNPRLVKQVAESILSLGFSGVQVFLATHSLFLLRELEILLSSSRYSHVASTFFGLHRMAGGTRVKQGPSISDIGDIAALDEQLEQSDRFLAEERKQNDDPLR